MRREEPATAPALPSTFVRRVASVLIALHLSAIFIAVTSDASPNYPAPLLAARAAGPLQPYLQATFLNNSYRFFAPNPGTPTVLWFRVQYQDRSVRWVELPGRADLVRAPYQRRLNVAVQFSQYLAPDPAGEGKTKTITPLGQTLLKSFVRHVAWAYPRHAADGKSSPVRNVGAYCLWHGVILPEQVRAGWEPTDLRTYRAVFLGAYAADGERIDEFRPAAIDQSMAYVTAGILEVDVLPRHASKGADALAELQLPEPVQRLLRRHPELLTAAPGADLKGRLEALVPEGSGESK
jgi:hypothetical protein